MQTLVLPLFYLTISKRQTFNEKKFVGFNHSGGSDVDSEFLPQEERSMRCVQPR
jgi:hypothetical protein